MKFHASIEGEEPRLGYRRDVRLVFNIADDKPRSGSLFLRKIGGLWTYVVKDRLDSPSKAAVSDTVVTNFGWNGNFEQTTN